MRPSREFVSPALLDRPAMIQRFPGSKWGNFSDSIGGSVCTIAILSFLFRWDRSDYGNTTKELKSGEFDRLYEDYRLLLTVTGFTVHVWATNRLLGQEFAAAGEYEETIGRKK